MSLKKELISGFFWTYLQQFSSQLINFSISIVLARLLLPEDFGTMGLIYIFITIGHVLIDGGLTLSLIRTLDADEEDFSTVFFTNIGVSVFVYFLTFVAAPFIADFYKLEMLINIIRVFALTFIISAFSSVQSAILSKNMQFKTQMLIAIPSIIASGIVGITLAFFDFGVWSLVWASITQNGIGTLQLWFYNDWRPKKVFNKIKFLKHLQFGYKLIITGVFDAIFVNIYPIFIGKTFSIKEVGFYTQAEGLKQLPISNVAGALSKVTLPLFSKIQNDNQKLKEAYSRITQLVLFITTPILIFMSVLANPLLLFLYSAKWVFAAPYLKILCFAGILPTINGYNINILNAKGKSDYILKIEVLNKIFLVALILIFYKYGIYVLVWTKLVSTIFSYLLNSYFCGKEINTSLLDQITSIIPVLSLSVLSGFVVQTIYTGLNVFQIPLFLKLLIPSFVGIIVYCGLIFIFKKKLIEELKLVVNAKFQYGK
ncbi:lipopolysaccharide biosynthesis protein [Flavobacterium sp. 83]|uniref:lipopolysaccharide biosynthesis protein n=1 Tax=Flavobacterium sp. 83 TaxID=1131812 RepID=UPI000551DEC0|nr:lipopolysaccharide biosynthesis protein [Flavobacterium sp. 83]